MHVNLSIKLVLVAFATLSLLEARIATANPTTTSTADVSTKSLPFLMRVLLLWRFSKSVLDVRHPAALLSDLCCSFEGLSEIHAISYIASSIRERKLMFYSRWNTILSLSLLRLFYVNREVRKYPISPHSLAGGAGDSPY